MNVTFVPIEQVVTKESIVLNGRAIGTVEKRVDCDGRYMASIWYGTVLVSSLGNTKEEAITATLTNAKKKIELASSAVAELTAEMEGEINENELV